MDGFERIKEILRRSPSVPLEESVEKDGRKRISIAPRPDGFLVSLSGRPGDYEVSFNGWHEPFDDAEEAVRCFLLGCSSRVRLEVSKRGDFEYRWVLQYKDGEQWVVDSITALFIFPFWRRKHTVYLQNNWLEE